MTSSSTSYSQTSIESLMHDIGKRAKSAASILANATTEHKNTALRHAAKLILEQKDLILAANQKDLSEARAKKLDKAMLDRLELTPKRLSDIAKGLNDIADLEDPVGKILAQWHRDSGLEIKRISIPLGVIGIIYESRPNVTADASALCLKSGNVAILRGGSESMHSSAAIIDCIRQSLEATHLPEDAVILVPTQDREAVGQLLRMNQFVDVIIPRGGKGLCKRVMDESTVPTLLHLDGNCHTYVHEKADKEKALSVVFNAKMRRTGICGATESLVIDRSVANYLLPAIADKLIAEGCEIRGDEAAQKIDNRIVPATEEDWSTEYLDSVISVKLCDGLTDAIEHINRYSSHHTDAIITEDQKAAQQFLSTIDSAIVMHNTSTQFADGGEFGMGAEIGISTGRLHARGPVGVEQLTTYKYIVSSDGATRPV